MTAPVLHCRGPRVSHHANTIKGVRLRKSARTVADSILPKGLLSKCLWAAFPSRSENELCNRAAYVLGVSPDTVRRMLKADDGRFSVVWPVIRLGQAAGVAVTLDWDAP